MHQSTNSNLATFVEFSDPYILSCGYFDNWWAFTNRLFRFTLAAHAHVWQAFLFCICLILIAHAQKLLFPSFWSKFRHRR